MIPNLRGEDETDDRVTYSGVVGLHQSDFVLILCGRTMREIRAQFIST
jgi:hypothetical protein